MTQEKLQENEKLWEIKYYVVGVTLVGNEVEVEIVFCVENENKCC